MQQSGLRADQVSQVRGFADQRLRNSNDPLDPANRRISIIVQYIAVPNDGNEKPGKTDGDDSEAKPSAEGAKADPTEKSTGRKDEQK
jgi:chemotaxis protein MotB